MTKKLSTIQTGVSGENFVAAELSRRGYVASVTLRNTRGIDILASNADATTSVGIQVKTSRGARAEWLLSKRAEADLATNLATPAGKRLLEFLQAPSKRGIHGHSEQLDAANDQPITIPLERAA